MMFHTASDIETCSSDEIGTTADYNSKAASKLATKNQTKISVHAEAKGEELLLPHGQSTFGNGQSTFGNGQSTFGNNSELEKENRLWGSLQNEGGLKEPSGAKKLRSALCKEQAAHKLEKKDEALAGLTLKKIVEGDFATTKASGQEMLKNWQERNKEVQLNLSAESVEEQIAIDLKKKIGEFSNPKIGLKMLARRMSIHEKTLKRLMNKENRAGYTTVYKIYRVLFDLQNDTELLEVVPKVIRDLIIKENPKRNTGEVEYRTDIEQEISQNPVFCEIFFMAGAGLIKRDWVLKRFGSYGLDVVANMQRKGVLLQVQAGTWTIGQVQANLGSLSIKKAGLHLTQKYVKPELCDELGSNFIGVFSEGLSKKAYDEWLKIDREAFDKKIQVSKSEGAKGDIKAFFFYTTDTMDSPCKES